jgi:hypothetical protein
VINDSSPKISQNYFAYTSPISITGGSAIISNNEIHSELRINNGSPVISDNNLYGIAVQDQYPEIDPIIINDGSPLILRNHIWGGQIGIEVKKGQPKIVGNTISLCDVAVAARGGIIETNYSANCSNGISAGNIVIRNNTFLDVARGIIVEDSAPTINYNNFQNAVGIYMKTFQNVDAIENFWGTTSLSEIDAKIWDFNDDFNLGKVNYTPFLTTPNSQAMPDSSASSYPSPTATQSANPSSSPSPSVPEFPVAVAFVVVFLVSAALVAVVKCKRGAGLGFS